MNLIRPSLERRLRDRFWKGMETFQVEQVMLDDLRERITTIVDRELCRTLLGDEMIVSEEHNMMHYLMEAREDI